ncbi:MAG: hemolysin III family protein [Owenweeksia sp.]|nr:hemolysin III family protein [Owenweeksia sp.]
MASVLSGLTLPPPYITCCIKRIPHCAIAGTGEITLLFTYLFAGTYTRWLFLPCLMGGAGYLIGIWTLAFAGIFSKVSFIGKYQKLSLVFYLAMGWMILIAIKPLTAYAPHGLLYWLLAGGILIAGKPDFFVVQAKV